MRYIPLTDSDREEMLKTIGVRTPQDLFASVPSTIRHKKPLSLPSAKTESELRDYFEALSAKNLCPSSQNGWSSFIGAGGYEHFIPTIVDSLASRGEFATAYTPYQPEVSQGTLQAIFEFQSMVANLFGMDAANASMYDGASAVAEAVLMAMRLKPTAKDVFLSKGLHPEYRHVIRSYLSDTEIRIQELDLDAQGQTVLPALKAGLVTIVVQQPNFYGVLERLEPISKAVHEAGGLLTVATTEALAFGVVQSPGAHGADIVAGEGQSFGNPLSFGGPWLGLFATRLEQIRQMPGRLVGKTTDQHGAPGYCLTLATREQHIRREKATSNICTNHSLCALRACIYMAALGERGLREVAERNLWAANRLKTQLKEITGIEFPYSGPIFNEFVVRLPISASAFLDAMEKQNILAGIPLYQYELGRDRELLVTVTETKDQSSIDRYADAAKKAL